MPSNNKGLMREFILLALKATTNPDFNLLELPKAGRLDLVCRTISNTLFVSNDLRRDTAIHVCLNGPTNPPKTISFYGSDLKGVEPDEISIAKVIKKALLLGKNLNLNENKEVQQGVIASKKAFETLVKEKKNKQLIYLHKKGQDIREFEFENDLVFILGDFIGLPKKTERLLDRLNAKKIKVGPKMLFVSHCSIIVHNELDRRER